MMTTDVGDDDDDDIPDGTGGDDDDDDDDDSDLPPPPATGIQIVEVTVDQGIRVPVARNGELVGGAERNQAILKDRASVVRAFYEVDPGYEARSIYAILTVVQGDGTETTYDSFVNTSEMPCDQQWIYDCRYSSPSGSFIWRVLPEEMQPDTQYRIEMFETSPGHEDDVSDKIPRFPTDGSNLIFGIEDQYMKMRVVVVPIYHDVGAECPEAPDMLEEFGVDYRGEPRTIASFFGDRLLAHNPADEVEIIVRDPVNYTGDMTTGAPLGMLQQLRFQDNAPPEYYYYGVGRPCQGQPDFAGIAQLGGPSMSEAGSRVGWGVFYNNPGTTAETFVHEIGHEQGRPHIACNGSEGGPDPSYPDHPEGDTESFGIDGIADPITIMPPSSHDYMTYCGNTWVSEWAWAKVFPWIQEISSWELGNVAPKPTEHVAKVMFGTVLEDGTVVHTFVTETLIDDARATADTHVRFEREGQVLADRGAIWTGASHEGVHSFMVEVPDDWETVDTLTFESPTYLIDIDPAEVQFVAKGDFTIGQ